MDKDWLAQAVVREAPEAIVVCDPSGTIVLWNGGAERIFGYLASEALGENLDLIIPEKQRARHWAGYEKTMATGETKYGDALLKVPASHRDGRRLSIEFSVALLRSADENGDEDKIAGIAAVIRDASERWAVDRELKLRLNEAERKLRELSGGAADASGTTE
jgi:PAS domain S-box-containing protein